MSAFVIEMFDYKHEMLSTIRRFECFEVQTQRKLYSYRLKRINYLKNNEYTT